MPAFDRRIGFRNRWLIMPEDICDMVPVDVPTGSCFTSRPKIYRIKSDRLLTHLTHPLAVVRKLLTK